ncbi:hypothetical protein J6590_031169 [Homalodisca vitripennis]|nr:hypothetical protein J6590_031169 [Homalodisca vitripennis]
MRYYIPRPHCATIALARRLSRDIVQTLPTSQLNINKPYNWGSHTVPLSPPFPALQNTFCYRLLPLPELVTSYNDELSNSP